MVVATGYEQAQVGGSGNGVKPIQHICVIKKVEETKSKAGNDMWVITFDFADSDIQPGLLAEKSADKDRWSNQGTYYIPFGLESSAKKQKAFITCVNESNGIEIDLSGSVKQFIGKEIGFQYRLEYWSYDGKEGVAAKPVWPMDSNKVDFEVDKLISVEAQEYSDRQNETNESGNSSFMDVADADATELPFK